MKRVLLLALGLMLATLLATAPAFAQQGPVTATGVLVGPVENDDPDPTPEFRLTDEATGTTYVLVSGFVDLAPFAGQRVTITGAPIGGADFAPPALNVTQIKPDTAHNEPTGTEEPEVIYGTYGDDWIYGEGGDDLLVGEAGPDFVEGGPGSDYLVAAYGYWQVAPYAPASPDLLRGGAGVDLIDSADLAGAPDTVECDEGSDLVRAGVEDYVAADCEFVYRYYGY